MPTGTLPTDVVGATCDLGEHVAAQEQLMELMNGSLMPENTQLGQALQPLHTTHQQLQPAYQSQSQQQPYMEQFTQHQLANFGLLSESEEALLCANTVTEEMSGFGGEDIFKYGSGSRISSSQGSGVALVCLLAIQTKKRRGGKERTNTSVLGVLSVQTDSAVTEPTPSVLLVSVSGTAVSRARWLTGPRTSASASYGRQS